MNNAEYLLYELLCSARENRPININQVKEFIDKLKAESYQEIMAQANANIQFWNPK